MIENIEAIEQSLGLESGKFIEMLNSEDSHTIDLSGLVIENKENYDTKLGNLKKTWQHNAIEEAIKLARTEHELDFQGKTMPNLIEALTKKVESNSKIEPEKRYSEMKEKFEKMQGIANDWEGKYNTLESNIKKERNQSIIDSSILKEIPDNTKIDKQDILAILKTKNEFDLSEDGNVKVLKNGKVLEDSATLNPLGVSDFMKDFVKPYLKDVEGGRGNQSQSGQFKKNSFESFEKEMETKGISGEAFNMEMQKRIKDGTLEI